MEAVPPGKPSGRRSNRRLELAAPAFKGILMFVIVQLSRRSSSAFR